MFLVEKDYKALWLVRDKATGRFMGFDQPTAYYSEDAAKKAVERQRGRKMSHIDWELVPIVIPERSRA